MFHPKWKRRPKGQYIYFSSAYTTSQRGGGGRVVCGVDFYREGSRMKEEEQLTCVRLASWLAGDGTIRYFDALQMATTFFLAGRERRASLARSLASRRGSTLNDANIPLKGRNLRRSPVSLPVTIVASQRRKLASSCPHPQPSRMEWE